MTLNQSVPTSHLDDPIKPRRSLCSYLEIYNQLLRKRKPNPTFPQTLKIDGKIINSSLLICQELIEHVVKIGEKLSGGTSFLIDKSFMKNLGKRNLSSIVTRTSK